jgi:hypothetical protein
VTAGTFTEDELKAGRKLFSAPARFLLGVAELEQLPAVRGVEIAVAGRSNVGKSSLINALTGVTGLARASNTPGRTRELNFFDVAGRLTMVDMPGYGFAKASKKDVKRWQAVLRAYLRGRPGLTRAFVLIDARHGVMDHHQGRQDQGKRTCGTAGRNAQGHQQTRRRNSGNPRHVGGKGHRHTRTPGGDRTPRGMTHIAALQCGELPYKAADFKRSLAP